MKIDVKSLRPCTAEVSPCCVQLIDHIKSAPDRQSFLTRLASVHEWQPQFGKSEMARWCDVLNMCDEVLESAVAHCPESSSAMKIDMDCSLASDVISVLSFTALLFENTFTRHIYKSADRVIQLLDASNMKIVVETLRLLQVMSKRSRFISHHLSAIEQKQLGMRLFAMAQCWTGRLGNLKMDECCATEWSLDLFPIRFQVGNSIKYIRDSQLTNDSWISELNEMLSGEMVESKERASLVARVRLARSFGNVHGRRLCVMSRLLSLSIIAYTRNLLEDWTLNCLVYDNLIEEITRLLLLKIPSTDPLIDSIKTEALRTLTSIVSLDRPAKLTLVIESLGVNSYHGFLARMTRICVDDLRSNRIGTKHCTSVQFCTSLFSLLYHLAGFDGGGEALVSCALTETLLAVIACESLPLVHISFVTRAVRVIDIMTSLDASGFSSCNGMSTIVRRLIYDVNICLKQGVRTSFSDAASEQCHQQRAALIKSLLNFIKRAIQDPQFADSVRHIMDGGLPGTLIQIIDNCTFFGASLFHNALGLITNFIYHEPSMLSSLQDKGVTNAIMRAIFHHELPTSKDVIATLPNTFTALCLNSRGLQAFIAQNPFEHFCKLLLSTKFIYAMKRRRNEMNEVALNLGTSLDELLRHQPTLRPLLLSSLTKVLDNLLEIASTDGHRCVMSLSGSRTCSLTTKDSPNTNTSSNPPEDEQNTGNNTSDDEDDDPVSAPVNMDEIRMSNINDGSIHGIKNEGDGLSISAIVGGVQVVPLGEYLINVGKLIETMLTHNTSTDEANAFINSGAVDKLLSLLFVKKILLELSQSSFPQVIIGILRSLFERTRNNEIIGMVAQKLLYYSNIVIECADGSDESTKPSFFPFCPTEMTTASICVISTYCSIISHLSRTALNNNSTIKNTVLKFWTSEEGIQLIIVCQKLNRIISWELAVVHCMSITNKSTSYTQTDRISSSVQNDEMMNIKVTHDTIGTESVPMQSSVCPCQCIEEKIWMRSKVGVNALHRCNRYLSEMVSVLCKVCIGTSSRSRRHEINTIAPCEHSSRLVMQLFRGFHDALRWRPQPNVDVKIMMSYLTAGITNINGILFDDRRYPYHLMLSAFYQIGCHDTFFNLINEYFSGEIYHANEVICGQFLLTWLVVVEKAVNAQSFRNSRYRLSDRCGEAKRFPAEKYLMKCQQDAFKQVYIIFEVLRNEAMNTNIYEAITSVFREVMKGIITTSSPNKSTGNSSNAEGRRPVNEVDDRNVDLLVDMGFDRDAAIDALLEYSNVPDAAEYLIATDGLGRLHHSSIAPRLDIEGETDEGGNPATSNQNLRTIDKKMENYERPRVMLRDVSPMNSSQVLDRLCEKIIPVILSYMEAGSELVFNTAEIMNVILNEVSPEWRDSVLVERYLITDIIAMIQRLEENQDEYTAIALSTRLHFSCLLWPQISPVMVDYCNRYKFHHTLISFLDFVSKHSIRTKTFWRLISPLCLWFDLYDKMLNMIDHKEKAEKCLENLKWKYWDTDDRNGSYAWADYPAEASEVLTNAFFKLQKAIDVVVGNHQYVIDFATMTQCNTETRVERPITVIGTLKSGADIVLKETQAIKDWNQILCEKMVPIIITLLGIKNLETPTVHAVFILLSRITRNFKIARELLNHGGIQAVIEMPGGMLPCASLFIALLVRHSLDDDKSLQQIFEKSIRGYALNGCIIHTTPSRWQHVRIPRTTRDWYHVMRAIAPICARNPQIFSSVMERVVRKVKGQIAVVATSVGCEHASKQPQPGLMVVVYLLNHILDFTWDDSLRVINRSTLIRLIAELIKSYSSIANLVAESHDSSGEPMLVALLNRCLVPPAGTKNNCILLNAMRSLIASIASCNHSPKAQDAMICAIIHCLHLAYSEQDLKLACSKINALAEMTLLARDTCPSSASDARAGFANTNSIIRVINKRRLCIEFAKASWHLDLTTREGIDTQNQVLRLLEELTRTINNSDVAHQDEEPKEPVINTAQNQSASVTLNTAEQNVTSATISAHENPTHDDSDEDYRAVNEPSFEEQEACFNSLSHARMEQEANNFEADNFEGEEDGDDANHREHEDESDSDDDDDADDDDDDDDDDDPHGNNEMDVDDESDEEHDDVMEEEGRVSDDEEDFNILGLDSSGPASRYAFVEAVDHAHRANHLPEDGGIEEQILNANVFLQGLDELSALADGSIPGAHLFVSTGTDGTANADRTSFAVSGAPHPMLQRNVYSNPSDANVGSRPQSYRYVVGQRRGTSNANPPGLHRQNAMRRWATYGTHGDTIERLLENNLSSRSPHILDIIPSRQRLLNIVMNEANEATAPPSSDRRQPIVPSPVERFTEASRLIDGHAHLYLWLLVVTQINRRLDEDEKDNSDKGKAEVSTTKSGSQFSRENEANEESHISSRRAIPILSATNPSHSGRTPHSTYVIRDGQLVSAQDLLMETHSTEIGNIDAPQPMDTLDTAFVEAGEDMEVIGMSPTAVNSENAGVVAPVNTESETSGVTQANFDASNEMNAIASSAIENVSRDTSTEATQMEAVPEPAQMETIPELAQMEAVVEPSHVEAMPDLAQMEAIPEQAQMEGASEATQMEAVSETTQMESAAESSRTEAHIESAQMEGTGEMAQMEAAAEATQMEAMPEATSMEEANDNTETLGLSQSNAEPVAAAVNSTPSAQMNNEYRDILGDIEIPEGVDPAFLAALPEDIRAEVVRDHLRQQRAQRLARPAAATAAAAAGSENAGTPGVEPLDQDFLNALPPDLQEEIMAQHERTIRLAVERNEQADVPASSAGANDAVALIESLPPTLRESILADVDDSVLQVLPQNVAAEARRLRGTNDDHSLSNVRQFMRFTRMLTPSQRFRPTAARPRSGLSAGGASIGALAGVTSLASKTAVQLMDRDALVTIIILLFVDPMSLNCQRLQKLIKSLCAHAPTCDFVVWCLLALLEKVNNNSNHDEEFIGTVGGWIDHICVTVGGCQHERVLKFFKQSSGVAVHPSVSATVTRLTLDTLISLAKSYPGHFLPAKLRSNDAFAANGSPIIPFDQFWQTVQNIARADARGIVSLIEKPSETLPSALVPFKATMASCTLEDSALGQLMLHMDRPIIRSQSQLQDKLLRLVCTVLQTLPDYTVTRMSIDQNAAMPPLAEQLGLIVKVMTEGSCSEDGLADGRILLMEAIRALTPSTKPYIESRIVDAAEILGARLLPHILQLQEELGGTISDGECSEIDPDEAAKSLPAPVGTLHDRFDASLVVINGGVNSRATINASGCQELQLPAMRELTAKNGIQNVFLRALQTVIRMRSGIRNGPDRNGDIQNEVVQEVERMSDLLKSLDPLWEAVSKCLRRLAAADIHAALALQPVTEAFFLIYGSSLSLINPDELMDHADAQKLFHFAETHRHMINQVLRQSNISLTDGPFNILIQMPRLLDFDVKRKYFRKQIDRLDERVRNDGCAVRIRRNHLFSDSFRELHRLQVSDWKSRFCIIFDGEEGQDAGGLLREWFSIITREIFNPNYALFITAPGDRVTYMINKTSYINPEHLDYFKFVGRIIAKAIYENKLLDCYFTRAFYKHILSVPVRAQDLESEDPGFYKSLEFLLSNPIEELGTELTFSLEVEEFGVRTMKELKENGTNMMVTDENKEEYVKLVCQMKMTGSINQQLNAFLDGFYEIIPKHLIAMFNEQELELLISGLPNIDIDDLYANTEYKSYTKTSPQIQWFWKALRSFEQEDRAKFLQFVTGTSKVPLLGFSELEGMNGVQKFSIHMDTCSSDRLPTAHTCFNQLDLPQYDSYDKLRDMLLLAVRECTEGFGFA